MKNFEGLLEQIKSCSKKKLAVAVAQDDAVLEAVKAAKDKDIADAILVGDADKITEIAARAIELTFVSNVSERDVRITGAFVPVKIQPFLTFAV